jgi:lipid II:glycine glycyltransferase (peptidoglycan interpeptide bridge formation enzyme)
MLQILTINHQDEWRSYVQRSANFDFYHTWYYHSLDTSGDSIMIVYTEGEDFIAFPLIRRSIPETNLCDLSSVYGYTGPISNKGFDQLNAGIIENFRREFLEYLKQSNCVSVFSRLHSFFNQAPLMDKFAGVYENGKTVVIDLQVPVEVQRSKYQKRVWEKIKALRRKGYYVKEGKSPAEVREFASIYTENMRRIEAADFYLFDEAYFQNMLDSSEFDSKLLTVYHNDKAVCGAVIVCTQKVIQAHLLGTRTSYLQFSPAKLLTDEICMLGREMGMEYFNLGGGLGFKEDSLFSWKAGFSDLFLKFNSWRFVADRETYASLVQQKGLQLDLDVDFFPLYRYTQTSDLPIVQGQRS